MVNQHNTQSLIATKERAVAAQPNLMRCLKHAMYFKSAQHFFQPVQLQQLADAIGIAERGHRGEIQVLIEASMPALIAYEQTTRQRAVQLFAEYGVWDTEFNSGVLIYLNMCEHAIEIVADRAIDRAVDSSCWADICQRMLVFFKQQQYSQGLTLAIQSIGALLAQFYGDDRHDVMGNELSNWPKIL